MSNTNNSDIDLDAIETQGHRPDELSEAADLESLGLDRFDVDNTSDVDLDVGAQTDNDADPDDAPDNDERRSGRRVGGVAPMVKPPGRVARMRAARRWSRRGFVPLGPRQEKRRHRILPRTVIGIASMLTALGIGAAFSGAGFYAYYDDRLAQNEQEVARFVDGFDQQFTDASGAIDSLRVESIDEIRAELAPLGEFVTEQNGVVQLPAVVGPSVWTVSTLDQAGVPIAGSAFAVTGHEGGTALLTSYSLIAASTTAPGPEIVLIKGTETIEATLWSWDAGRDLALIVTPEEIPLLDIAVGTDQIDALGARVFAVSGSGGQGATASPGVLVDQSELGLQHTAAVGQAFVGGPLVDGSGLVVGVATLTYEPLGFANGAVSSAPDARGICARILRCADGTVSSVGDSGSG